jgi:membrane protein required for beta-lactamase induction
MVKIALKIEKMQKSYFELIVKFYNLLIFWYIIQFTYSLYFYNILAYTINYSIVKMNNL